ncbi:DNA/RNA polymerase [Exidia glandulosa HHB12029]|uniref:DNA polymerase n=1 Tax=Exidia glandulosa HHB12029 TaxID=1314781 RepID=A0A165PHR7_EXIGL|nr:DNA/RNA polymerase [Exidia glandulosa HHB12029]
MRVSINQIDASIERCGSLDNGERRKVPILRVFGRTEDGIPACVHVHQVFPYFYVNYTGDMDHIKVASYIRNLRIAIDHALALARRIVPGSPEAVFVKHIMPVKGTDFYGFHKDFAPFLKIYFYNPSSIALAATSLRLGTIMGTKFTVYEAHLNFPLQFMCDFALYGCNWMDLGEVFVRGDSSSDWRVSEYPKKTRMQLEVDVCAHQVLNRLVLAPRDHFKPSEQPQISSVRELWDDERRRRAAAGLHPSPEMPSVLSQGSRAAGGNWSNETRFREQLAERIAAEPIAMEQDPEPAWAALLLTTFESIDSLWDRKYRTSTLNAPPPQKPIPLPDQPTDIQVDEAAILSQPFTNELHEERERQFDEERRPEESWDMEDPQQKPGTNALSPSKWNPKAKLGDSPRKQRPGSDDDDVDEHALRQTQSAAQMFDKFSSQESDAERPRKRARVDPWSAFSITQTQSPSSSQVNCFEFARRAPTARELLATLGDHRLRHTVYREAHYSNPHDRPSTVTSDPVTELTFDLRGGIGEWEDGQVWRNRAFRLEGRAVPGWEYAGSPPPPRVGQVRRWLQKEVDDGVVASLQSSLSQTRFRSQIEGPTQRPITQAHGSANVREGSNMSSLALEVFALSVGDKKPDPQKDPICAVFYSFLDGAQPAFEDATARRSAYTSGIIALCSAKLDPARLRDHHLEVVDSELDLINAAIDQVVSLDPDIVCGWEVQVASWGYLRVRGDTYGLDVLDLVGRAHQGSNKRGGSENYEATHASIIRVTGRHVLNVWRVMRADMALSSYTFENVAFKVLKRRMHNYSAKTLTHLMNSDLALHNSRALQYFVERTATVLDILDETETISKTAEFARVFGIDFFSVISRGSQYKVESFLFRMCKPESFLVMSPSKDDVGKQNAIYATPLILEPRADFYTSPMVVLDFQSLYPSVMIAYNLCYSTCLGRVTQQNGHWKLGVRPDFELPPGLLDELGEESLFIAPNGLIYVKPEVREGILGRMLRELLETRIMVKQGMKLANGNKGLYSTLDARQLSLKFICNVTYGYTSATFSGRMPAVEIADSIVQTGRETLTKAIDFINANTKWGGTAVYGDTDSVFVYLPGKTKDEAFRIGHDIADTITAMNPDPMKLKFEKVYHPAVLMAKKRYVGFKYETPDEVEPAFDAKGIETVRRDFTPATQKMLETTIKMLFRSQDLSQIKDYCVRSWQKIVEERVSLQDFIQAKEVRMGTYSADSAPPPGVVVAARQQIDDPNDEAQYGDRIMYLVPRRATKNERLANRAVSPHEFIRDRMHLDAQYYIERMIIPPLSRVLRLAGVLDVKAWYKNMPKTVRVERDEREGGSAQTKLEKHFQSSMCISCGHSGMLTKGVCEACKTARGQSTMRLVRRIRTIETREREANVVCASCTGSMPGEEIKCDSLDCAWFFERHKVAQETEFLPTLRAAIQHLDA